MLDAVPRRSENARVGNTSQQLISLQAAWGHIRQATRPGPVEQVLVVAAHGRVLAEPVIATGDYPAFDKAMMDGYAVRAQSTAAAPCTLSVVGEARAGYASATQLGHGEAMRINTGAPLPPGSDAIVPVEATEADASGSVRILKSVSPGKCIAKRGSIRAPGQVILTPPTRIRSAQLAALATAGVTSIAAYRRPTVAVVVTGDELIPLGTAARPGQIVDSNGPMLAALARECGAALGRSAVARDDEGDLREKLADALAAAEGGVVVAVGGMSKGTRDLVPGVAEGLGVRWVFHGVDLRPGKPTAFGLGPAGQHVFGLPGNPVSCAVCFLLFVRMSIEGLSGSGRGAPPMMRVRLAESIEAGPDSRPSFLPAMISLEDDEPTARLAAWRGSSDPFGPGAANGYVYQTRGDRRVAAGDRALAIAMPGTLDDWITMMATKG